jgi:hypothetical protein
MVALELAYFLTSRPDLVVEAGEITSSASDRDRLQLRLKELKQKYFRKCIFI